MPIRIDPEENELHALRQVTSWRHKAVLEIGCGDGRLSLRLARLGANVTALDPEKDLIRQARRTLPSRFANQIRYHVGSAERLKFRSRSFDVVLFAWSL